MPSLPKAHSPIKPKAKRHELPTNYGKSRGSSRPWERKRQRVFLRDQYTCQGCGLVTHELECDHIVPQSQCGGDGDDNLQSLCSGCHKSKSIKESMQSGNLVPKIAQKSDGGRL